MKYGECFILRLDVKLYTPLRQYLFFSDLITLIFTNNFSKAFGQRLVEKLSKAVCLTMKVI